LLRKVDEETGMGRIYVISEKVSGCKIEKLGTRLHGLQIATLTGNVLLHKKQEVLGRTDRLNFR
jgi:hypothetical protein